MKKILQIASMLIMAFSLIATSTVSLADSSTGGRKVILDFDSIVNKTTLDNKIIPYKAGANLIPSINTKYKESGSNSLQIDVGAPANGQTWGVVDIQVPSNMTDWSQADGIEFWAHSTGGSVTKPNYVAFELSFDEYSNPQKPERWMVCGGQPYSATYLPDNRIETRTLGGDPTSGRVTINDGEMSLIKIPFSSFAATVQAWGYDDGELNLHDVRLIHISAGSDFFKGKEFQIDDISLYGSKIQNNTSLTSVATTKTASTSATQKVTSAGTQSATQSSSNSSVSSVISGAESSSASLDTSSSSSSSSSIISSDESSNASSTASSGNSDNNGGLIAAIVIIAVVLLGGAGTATYLLFFKKK